MDLLWALGLILSCWAAGVATLIGWGMWAQRLPRLHSQQLSLVRALWLGLLVVVAWLQLAHFFWPIDGRVSLVLAAGGLAGIAANFPAIRRRLQERPVARSQWIVVAAVALWLADISLHGVRDIDTGLYHLQTVKWFQTYPVVPGLGNLHGRLAFNSAAHLLFAALAVGPWKSHGLSVANGFLLLLLSLHGARYLGAWGRLHAPAMRRFWILLLPLLACWAFTVPGTYETDVAPFMLLIAATSFAAEALGSAVGSRPNELLITAGVLALGALVMKLSAVAYVIAFLPLMWWFAGAGQRGAFAKVIGAGALVLLAPWVGRNVVLSGCLVYPLAFTRLPLSWAMAPMAIRWEAYAIHTWATWNGWPPPNAGVIAWVKQFLRECGYGYTRTFLPLLVAIALAWTGRRKRAWSPQRLWLLLPAMLALMFWFFSAPAVRFAGPLLWMSAAIVAAASFPASPGKSERRLVALAAACTLLMGLGSGWELLHGDWRTLEPLRDFLVAIMATPGADHGFPLLAQPPVRPVPTSAGLLVNVPAGRFSPVPAPVALQPYDHAQVGDAPLPASPFLDPHLRLRNPAALRYGFTVNSHGW